MATTQQQKKSIEGVIKSFAPFDTPEKRNSAIELIKSFGADPADFDLGETSTQTEQQGLSAQDKEAVIGAGLAGGLSQEQAEQIANVGQQGGGQTDDVILNDVLNDPDSKTAFDSLPEDIQGLIQAVLDQLNLSIEAGNVVNPDIEITQEEADKFLAQAETELEPFFQEQLANFKQDLATSTQRLQEDFETGVRRAEEPFKQNLLAQAETEAQAGLAFGSERGRREQTNIRGQQERIEDVTKGVARSFQDIGRRAERKIGSEAFAGLGVPAVQQFGVSRQGFTPSGTRQLFTPQGNLLGEDVKAKKVAVKSRASDLETEFRRERSLNLSNL